MKKLIFIALISLLITGCGQKAREEAERLQQEKLALQEQLETQEESINEFLSAINQIEENLALIREKERAISQGARENLERQDGQMERINDDIRLIGELMQQNRQLISRLNRDLRGSNLRIGEFEKRVAELNERIVQKESEIAALQEELSRMNLRVDYLTSTIDTLQLAAQERVRFINAQTAEMNTAFYTMGSRRELLEWGVIIRQGGFLGIGRTNRLHPEVEQVHFARIDQTQVREITIAGTNPNLITPHPEGSWEYLTENGITSLVILDPSKFWSTSRYLVIELE
ncbi:MAG TPA: hypothetical protein VLH61_10110 [Bacteroidales bacterium]|nr:hypothetical protein [Bacteroidales bacterium]